MLLNIRDGYSMNWYKRLIINVEFVGVEYLEGVVWLTNI